MRRRLAVIFMADMIGYSRLMEADQEGTIGLVQELREQWLEPEAEKRGGEVLKRMGDGWIIAFSSVTDAVETAQTVQSTLASHEKIKLRIAAHLGEISEDGADLYGAGINITARLQTEAAPGGVLISEDLHRQLDEKLAEGFSDVGSFDLKNIAQPVAGFQWRPVASNGSPIDDVPVIAIEPLAVVPDQPEPREAAADLQEQLALRLSRRTGIRVLFLEREDSSQATYLLKGRLRASGARAKLTLSLLLGESGGVVWSDAYEGASDGIFELVDHAAGQADADLRQTINMLDGERFARLPEDALSASELRARAANSFYASTVASYEQAIDLLDRALGLAPENPMSLAMWAHAWTWLLRARFETGDRALVSMIVTRADAAVQSAPRSDFVGKVRAEVRLKLMGDIEGAKRACTRVNEINPGYTSLKVVEVEIALAEGNWRQVGVLATSFCDQYPKDAFIPYLLYIRSVAELLAGQLDKAERSASEAIEMRPACRRYRLLLAEIYRRTGDSLAEEKTRAVAVENADELDLYAPALAVPASAADLMEILSPTHADKAST